MKKFLRAKGILYFLVAIVFFLVGYLLNQKFEIAGSDKLAMTNKLQRLVLEKENEVKDLQHYALNIAETHGAEGLFGENALNSLGERGYSLFMYRNDTLIFWSDVCVPVDAIYDSIRFSSNILLSANGWYNVVQQQKGPYRVVGLVLLKHEYRYENDYLSNSFLDDYDLPDNVEIQKGSGDRSIYDGSGALLCSLKFNRQEPLSTSSAVMLFVLYFAGLLFFIASLFQMHKYLFFHYKSPLLFVPGFIIDVLILRLLTFHFKWPAALYQSVIFSPLKFASSELFPSFGDLLLNVAVFLVLSFVFYRHFHINKHSFKWRPPALFLVILSGLSIFSLGLCYAYLIRGLKHLVLDSVIPYTLNNIFNLSTYSVFGFIVMAAAVLGFVLISQKITSLIFGSSKTKAYIIAVAVGLALFVFYQLITRPHHYFIPTGFVLFITGLCILRARPGAKRTFTRLIFCLVFFSIVCTFSLHHSNAFKESEKRKSLAQKLANSQDPVAEYLYTQIEPEIVQDAKLNQMIGNYIADEAQVASYLMKNYFNGYWDKYQVQITLCDQDDSLFIKPALINQSCNDYFNSLVKDVGKPTNAPGLTVLNYGTGGNSYLARLVFPIDSSRKVTAFIELYSKFIPKGLGYPELLIDKKIFLNTDLSNYSYARYRNGRLADAYGKYYYSMIQDGRDTINENLTVFDRNNYNHLIYKIDKNSNLIISSKSGNWLEYMAPFSLLFLFFSVFMLLFFIVIAYPYKENRLRLNFKNRLQISMISIILISFILIGISMVYYIKSLNDNKNTDNLSEKALSILLEVQSKLAQYDTLSLDLESYMSNYLVKFSNVFFTDINLYDLNGDLLASSRPQVFNEGLLSRKINNIAYNELVYNRKTIFLHKEQIGNLEYYSAYVPFYNYNNELVAYLNLPYFAKENELKQELSTFMMTFINIYVFLIAIAIIIALFIAGRMTRPLKEIREKISHVRLGGKNEKIRWLRKDDEIGSLVTEYNRMIDELALSADLLAKSERESAWREMAKQVAHEIKNPLTPMKLSVQYLEKAWKEKAPDWENKLERFSKTLIEQIESLAAIATAFSDFAKMPKSEMQEIDLLELISTVLATYTGNQTLIRMDGDTDRPCYVMADRKQLNRALINLITNSLQAIDNHKDGLIMIHVEHLEEKVRIHVKDNGPGISEEQKPRIFVPNFSTKSDGMGLGLAMVKSIIEGHGGAIWFISREGEGATFSFELPVFSEKQ